MEKKDDKDAPVLRVTRGNVTVSGWSRESPRGGTYVQYSVQKSWKDKDGVWQNSGSFNHSDLPSLIMALAAAYEGKYIDKGVSR